MAQCRLCLESDGWLPVDNPSLMTPEDEEGRNIPALSRKYFIHKNNVKEYVKTTSIIQT